MSLLVSQSVKMEYFNLINKLNLSNKLKNQNTEIYFYVDETDFTVAKLFAAISKGQKILLIEKNSKGYWEPVYLSGFSNLEEFLVKLMNTQKQVGNLTDLIKSHIFKPE